MLPILNSLGLVTAITSADELLRDFLAVSVAGVILYTPLYDPADSDEIVDFTFEYLNPAAQRMMRMPERPTFTYMGQWPHSKAHGTFQLHVEAYVTGELREYNVNYQADGYNNYYRLAARRSGPSLLVSFSDTADQPRSPMELALREAQTLAQEARAEADAQRQRLHDVLMALPAQVATYRGPDHVHDLVNPRYQLLFPTRRVQDVPLRQALPELEGQETLERFDHVYHTGETHFEPEQEKWVDLTGTGHLEQRYFSVLFQALRDGQGRIDGILNFAYDITEQVLARRQVQQLIQELEARVQQRTLEAEVARAEAEKQRNRLLRLFSQAPAQINLFVGPEHIWTLVHPRTQQLLPNRPLLGLPYRQALPELPEEEHALFDQVYRTGKPVYMLETPERLPYVHTGGLHEEYLDLTLQPKFNAAGQIEGVMSFAVNVTERVRSRRQTEALQTQVLAAVQQQARQREAFFHILADTPAAVALLRGPQHCFEYVNVAYQQLFPDRQLTGRPVAEALPEIEEAGFLAQLDTVYRTGNTFFGTELPMHLASADSLSAQQVYYTFTYQAYREEGRIVGISIFAFDVTEQVQARAQREAERLRLYSLFMEAPAPIVIFDGPALVYQLVNPAYQRIFPGRALLGKPVLEALPELADTPVFTILQQVYRTGETYVAQEMPLQLARTKGGPLEEIYWTFTYQARRSTQGQVDGILAFAHEVTDQVQARRVVERSEQYLRQMADNVPTMIWLTNAASQCIYLNQQWYSYTAQTQAEGLGLGWLDAVHPDDQTPTHAAFVEAAACQAHFSLLYRQRRQDGCYRWAINTGSPRFTRDGQFDGYVGTIYDIDEQKQAEQALQHLTSGLRTARDRAEALNQELQASNEQLRRTNVDLDNFIYTASHDLKAPISNIEGLLYLLREELPANLAEEEPIATTLTYMLNSVERFKRTIEHLTDVSKLQKEHAPASASVNLTTVVENVRQDLAPLLQATDTKLVVEVDAPPIQFSEKNLRSVVYNLLSNAVKYHSPDRKPHVNMRTYLRSSYIVLEVHDNGLGIEATHVPRLFSMFQRFHSHVEGSGIGLYMVKRIVENAGGRIEVNSQLGVGTTFLVYLPHATGPSAEGVSFS